MKKVVALVLVLSAVSLLLLSQMPSSRFTSRDAELEASKNQISKPEANRYQHAEVSLIATSVVDQTAVISGDETGPTIVKKGDQIESLGWRLELVAQERVVFKDVNNADVIFLDKKVDSNTASKQTRLSNAPDYDEMPQFGFSTITPEGETKKE